MSSVVQSPDGRTLLAESLYQDAHCMADSPTVQTDNPLSCVIAWIRGLQHRAKLDGNFELKTFADTLEAAAIETVESGKITKDLWSLVSIGDPAQEEHDEFLSAEEVIDAIAVTLQDKMIRGAKIIYTLTDEAPMLATYAFLPCKV